MTQVIDAVLAGAVERGEVAGVVAVAVDRNGTLYEGAFGRQRVAEQVEMRLDSLFQIASMTKGPASVAALQLVERGLLSLDAPAAEVLPELAAVQVLEEDGTLRAPVRPVTLRHLLTHTAGFGYPFTSARLGRYRTAAARSGAPAQDPLLFDPGEDWQYGTNTDWAGRMVAAASGVPLDVYLAREVLGPLGMRETGYAVAAGDESRLASSHRRLADGSVRELPFAGPEVRVSGGGGLISTASDYARFVRMLLRGGELDGTRLLGAESIEALSANQIGELSAGRWRTGTPEQSNDTDFSDDGTARWSLGFLLQTRGVAGGRSAGTLSWGGIQNTYYWIDPVEGIGGVFMTQVRPFADATCLAVRDAFEHAVYAAFRGNPDSMLPTLPPWEVGASSGLRPEGPSTPLRGFAPETPNAGGDT